MYYLLDILLIKNIFIKILDKKKLNIDYKFHLWINKKYLLCKVEILVSSLNLPNSVNNL